MPHNYSWTATDRFGQKVVKEVEAETAQEAQNKLLADGYSNLVLKEDEVMEVARTGFPKNPTFLGAPINVTAEDRLRHLDNPTVTFWDVLKKASDRARFWLSS